MNTHPDKKTIAVQFGKYLDQDNFKYLESILNDDCKYLIGDQLIVGKKEISTMYREAMIEGRKKFDVLNWGKSQITEVSSHEFDVLFTDNFIHKGIAHQYSCRQRVSVDNSCRIVKIQHFEIQEEREKLDKYLKQVGLK